jgi:hypothetical protein
MEKIDVKKIANIKPASLSAFSDEQIICATEKIKARALPIYNPELSQVFSNLSSKSAEFQTIIKGVKGKEGKALKTLIRLASYNVSLKTNESISKARDLYCQAVKRAEITELQGVIKLLIELCDMHSTCTESLVGADGYAWHNSEGADDVLVIDMGIPCALPVQWLHQELTD